MSYIHVHCKHAEIFKNTREVHEAQPSTSRTSREQLVKHFIITKKNTGIFTSVDSFVGTLNLLNGLVTSTFMYCLLSDHFLGYDVRYCFTQYNNKNILYYT